MGNEKTIEVKGKDLGDVLVREAALSKLNGLEGLRHPLFGDHQTRSSIFFDRV